MVTKMTSPNPRRVLLWLLVIALPIALGMALVGFVLILPTDVKIEIAKRNLAALVGLPVAAVFALLLVLGLQQASGPIKFEGLGFKFEGASGQIILWVFTFLAMAGAIKLLWI
jgi:hypothetical protein